MKINNVYADNLANYGPLDPDHLHDHDGAYSIIAHFTIIIGLFASVCIM